MPNDEPGALVEGRIATGELWLSNTPLLSCHDGLQPDLFLHWNDMPDAAAPLDIVVHLHGFADEGKPMRLPVAVERSGLDFADPVQSVSVRRERPTLGIVPRGNHVSGRRYDFPALRTKAGLGQLIDFAIAAFAKKTGANPRTRGRIILTAHSGSGIEINGIVRTSSLVPDEIHLFDATYQPFPDVGKWAARRIAQDQQAVAGLDASEARARLLERGGALRIISGAGTRNNAQVLYDIVSDALDARAAPGVVRRFYRLDRTEVGHYEIPPQFGFRLLAAADADLSDAAGRPSAAVLARGSEGEPVVRWQAFLVTQAIRQDPPDGVFDAATVEETRRFQQTFDLDDDGRVGRRTMRAARAVGFDPDVQAGPPPPPPPKPAGPQAGTGDVPTTAAPADASSRTFSTATLASARAVQEVLTRCGYLDPPADGAFGPVSKWALWEFAKRAGLSSSEFGNAMDAALSAAQPLPLTPGTDLAGRIAAAMQTRGHWIARHPDCLNIVYVEGMNMDGTPNDNRNNVFNDLRMVIRINAQGVPVIAGRWEATTEPSRAFTIDPMNSAGAFHIKFGQYKSWIKGYYHEDEALIQAGPIDGFRDPHKTFKRDERYPVTGEFGVHHHGGYNLPHDNMGNSSAGCLVGRLTQGHQDFINLVKTDVRYRANPTYRFMAAIIPASSVAPAG